MSIDLAKMISEETVWRVGDVVHHKGTGERIFVTSMEPLEVTWLDDESDEWKVAHMAAKKESLEDLVRAYLDAINPDSPPVSEGERIKALEALAAAVA